MPGGPLRDVRRLLTLVDKGYWVGRSRRSAHVCVCSRRTRAWRTRARLSARADVLAQLQRKNVDAEHVKPELRRSKAQAVALEKESRGASGPPCSLGSARAEVQDSEHEGGVGRGCSWVG
jgi:hypothetical protein